MSIAIRLEESYVDSVTDAESVMITPAFTKPRHARVVAHGGAVHIVVQVDAVATGTDFILMDGENVIVALGVGEIVAAIASSGESATVQATIVRESS